MKTFTKKQFENYINEKIGAQNDKIKSFYTDKDTQAITYHEGYLAALNNIKEDIERLDFNSNIYQYCKD